MKLEKAYKIVEDVLDYCEQEHLSPQFNTDEEIEALQVIFDTVGANLDNLEDEL